MLLPSKVVGWNWTNSMSLSETPARYGTAIPIPLLMMAFVELP